MNEFYRWQGEVLHLFIKVQPKASKNEFAEVLEDRIKVRITAPPVDGKANEGLVKFIAKTFGVAKSQVEIDSGETGRNKHLIIQAPTKLLEGIEKIG
jgi:hypothetical protein